MQKSGYDIITGSTFGLKVVSDLARRSTLTRQLLSFKAIRPI